MLCVRCKKVPLKAFVCGGCNTPVYCGEACQDSHWKNGHAEECPGRGAPQQTIDASVIFGLRKGHGQNFGWIWENVVGPHFELEPSAIIDDWLDIKRDNNPNDLLPNAELAQMHRARIDFFKWLFDNKQEKPAVFNDLYPTLTDRNKLVADLFQAACSAEQKQGYEAPEILVAELIECLEGLRYKPLVRKKLYTDGFKAAMYIKNVGVLRLLIDKGRAVNFDASTFYELEEKFYGQDLSDNFIMLLKLGVSSAGIRFGVWGESLFGYACIKNMDKLVLYIIENHKSEFDMQRGYLRWYWNAADDRSAILKILCEHKLYEIEPEDLEYSMKKDVSCVKVCLDYGNFQSLVLEDVFDNVLQERDRKHQILLYVLPTFLKYIELTKDRVKLIVRSIRYVEKSGDDDFLLEAAKICFKSGHVTDKLKIELFGIARQKRNYLLQRLCLQYDDNSVISIENSYPLLSHLAEVEDLEFFKSLLFKKNINIDATESLPLVCYGTEDKLRLEIIELLLKKGVDDFNQAVRRVVNYDVRSKPKIATMKLLLKYGLDVNVAIIQSINSKNYRMLQMLLVDEVIDQTQISTDLLEKIYGNYPDLRNRIVEIRPEVQKLDETQEPPTKLLKK